MYNVRVIIDDNWAFTPDTKEERDRSIIMQFDEKDAADLISGFGVDISIRIIHPN